MMAMCIILCRPPHASLYLCTAGHSGTCTSSDTKSCSAPFLKLPSQKPADEAYGGSEDEQAALQCATAALFWFSLSAFSLSLLCLRFTSRALCLSFNDLSFCPTISPGAGMNLSQSTPMSL